MSRSKNLIINCGASQLSAAVIDPHSGRLELEKLVTVSLDYDYSEDEAWLDAVGGALRELSRTHKLSGKASIIIPGNQVLTKTIRIPHVEASKRAQIIAFEAQQSIPYPLHEVVWDSQVVGDDGVETEVLFIACKSEVVDQLCAAVSASGFVPEAISAATVLDYNALQFSGLDSEEDLLLVNVGARSTNLLFKNSDGFFVRNIQLGGNSLTQSIADSLGKNFSQAEAVKCKFFAEEFDRSDEDSGAKALQTSAEAFGRRMNQEITRSIVNYRRQKGAGAPKRILLSGRGALLKGLKEQLSASQKMPVEFFDPLQNVTLGANIAMDPDELRLAISEVIGQAAAPLVPTPAGVNLLPEEIQAALAFQSKKPWLLVAAACLALAPWPAFFGYKQLNNHYQERARAIQSQLSPLQSKQSAIFASEEAALALGASIERVEGLVNSKTNWIQFFATLQESLLDVEDVWLDDLAVVRSGSGASGASGTSGASYEIVLQGQMLVRESAGGETIDQEVLSRRIKSLQSSFESSEFVLSSKPPSINWNSLRNGLNVLPFSINLVVDTTKTL
jgi:type IV pilus assembly protein PilM